MLNKKYYIDVILPLPLKNLFTYQINSEEAKFLKTGMRVTVPFGKSKIYTSIVYQVHTTSPLGYEIKEIEQILDEYPIVTVQQIQHWQWIASYYMCALGEVMKAAVSNSFLLESETIIALHPDYKNEENLSENENKIIQTLIEQNSLKISDVQLKLSIKKVFPLLHQLVQKNKISIYEEITEQYKPKWIKLVKVTENIKKEDALKEILFELKNASKQRKVFLTLISLEAKEKSPIQSKRLIQESGSTSAVLKSLVEKGIIEEFEIQSDRLHFSEKDTETIKELNTHQQKAYQSIKQQFIHKNILLLHGITSSGKTEIYVKLIKEQLETGHQVLYLLPEISLTAQLIRRLQIYFGQQVTIYHSGLSANERVEVWYNVLNNKENAQIIVGARSAIFLPFKQLGMIIVDEEHEHTYKQYNPSPRYHARDTAIILAKEHQAKVLLGSATPSLESYYNASIGKFGLVSLNHRHGNVKIPEIQLVNLKDSYRKKKMNGHFSLELLEAIKVALKNGEQVILFQNRRGFSPTVECRTCGHTPHCPNCDVTLTYHKGKSQLRCHYCGYFMAMQNQCMACNSFEIDTKGLGTEQIEYELKAIFPDRRIARMDQDTTRGKKGYSKIIQALEQRQIDILVGTQMIAKGLDFRHVTLVGVMNADNLLNYPDFRAHERSFQMLSQVSGRAGRTEKQGKVIIQSFEPNHYIIQQVLNNDYKAMYDRQMADRQKFNYPPFYRLIRIIVKCRNYDKMQQAALWLSIALKNNFGSHVLGPEQPPVGRIKNEFINQLLIKLENGSSLQKAKKILYKTEKSFLAIKEYNTVKIILDVDYY